MLFAGDPEHLVEPMDSPIAELAVGVIEITAKAARMNRAAPRLIFFARIAAVIRPERRGSAPHLPIEFLRNFLRRQRFLATAAIMDKAADHANFANFARANKFPAADIMGRNAAMC